MFALPLRSSNPDFLYGKYAASLFAAGERGVWYDPSDMSTMFQDAAGTTPVTAMEQPVGRILDKSGRGNHATQTTATSRPVLSARYNMLERTESIDASNWVKFSTMAIPNSATAPDGNNTAESIFEGTANSYHWVFQPINSNLLLASISYTFSAYVKGNGRDWCVVTIFDGLRDFGLYFQLTGNGAVGGRFGSTGTVNGNISNIGNGWYRCAITVLIPPNTRTSTPNVGISPATSNGVNIYPGDPTKGIYAWGADLRASNESSSLPAYQRVNTATDYDTQGFPPYLRFDGVDDWLVTPPIDFTATDKMTVFTGVRKLSDTISILCELGTNWTIRNGFYLASQLYAGVPYYTFGPRGNRGAVVNDETNVSTSTAPDSAVITSQVSMNAGTPAQIRRNAGSFQDSINTSFGGGNFGNHPVYIGRRNGTEYPFNGRLYGLILRGAQTGTTDLTNVERYLAYKSGVVL